MTLPQLLALLTNVTGPRNGRYRATCPAHADIHPSLSVGAGDANLMLRCWSGCTVKAIMAALHLKHSDVFYEATTDKAAIKKAMAVKRTRALAVARAGRVLDAIREADYFVRSRRGMDIAAWSDVHLDFELEKLARAYRLLEKDSCR